MEKDNLKWLVLATVMIGTFLGRIDQTIVNLALPSIIDDFGISVSAAGWIATAYIIANAIFVPVWGKLGDKLGRKKIYIWGFVVFIIGSILAGLSWNLSSMLLFRIIQAIASSADYPTAMAIIAVTFREGKERAQALGIWSASFAAGAVFGPLIGGPLIDYFGWRSVFLINLPIGIIGTVMALAFVHESKVEKKSFDFDWFGALTLGIALSSLVLVLDKGIEWGWTSDKSIISYIIIILFLIIFYFNEKKHTEPMIDLKFFKNKVFTGTIINNFMVFMGMMGGIFLIPVFAQTFMGLNATQSGYLFIPMAIFLMIAAQIGGKMIGKIKSNIIISVSTFLAAVGLFFLGYFLDPRSTIMDILVPLSFFAFGLGLGMAQRTNAIATVVPEKEIGIASSILALTRNVAGAFGIAIFATILTNIAENNILEITKNTVINTLDPIVYKEVVALIILKAQVSAYVSVFQLAALFVFVGAIVAFFIKIPDTKKEVHVEG